MNEQDRDAAPSAAGADLPPDDLETIDALCDAFESDLRRVSWPKAEHYLERVDERLRPRLLHELLRTEKHWRTEAAEASRVRDDLRRRLPGHVEEIERVWRPAQQPAASLVTQGTSLGPYRNLEPLGEGGFGVVYRAWDDRHDRVVALKMPRFGFGPSEEEFDRFLREAKAAGSLDHPGIARVWDSGRIAGVTFIAYQFIEGENLKTRLDEIAAWPAPRIASLVAKLADAVQCAHEQGVIHRDIKPSNVLLTADGAPVLTDFGLALAVGGDATRSLAARVGTLDYMSPEQARGDSAHVDGRADVWSLGVLLYELATGRKPFEAPSDIELLRAIVESTPKRPRGLRRDTPRDLDVVVMRCLEKRRADRLASCKILSQELGRVSRGEPVLSRPVSPIEQTIRWCRRNPRPVLAFSLILAATAFGAWSWGGWVNENRERENTVQSLQIEIEAGRARRRALLADLLIQGAKPIRLDTEDLEFLESQMVRHVDASARGRAAVLLARQGWFTPARYPTGSQQHDRIVEELKSIVDSYEAESSGRAEVITALTALGE